MARKKQQIDPKFGGMIRDARYKKGITVRKEATDLGLSTSGLSRLETGTQRISSAKLLRSLSEYLDIPLYDLLAAATPRAQQYIKDMEENPDKADDEFKYIKHYNSLDDMSAALGISVDEVWLTGAQAMLDFEVTGEWKNGDICVH